MDKTQLRRGVQHGKWIDMHRGRKGDSSTWPSTKVSIPTCETRSPMRGAALVAASRNRNGKSLSTSQGHAGQAVPTCTMTSIGPWLDGGGTFDPSSWDVWDPFTSGWGIWGNPALWGGRRERNDEPSALARTYVDWRETDDAHIFLADMPGVRREELRVQVDDNNILQISGERTKAEEMTGDTWHRVERQRGSFVRRFKLPDKANLDGVQCGLDHGVLTVTVPKKAKSEQASSDIRSIDIS